MAIINTTDDLIRAMDENPEWLEAVRRRVLTRELLELPEKLAQLSREVALFAETTNRRLSALEKTVADLATSQVRLEKTVADLATSHTQLAASHTRLETSHTQLVASHTQLVASHNRMERHVDSMRGDHLEMRLQGRIYALLGGHGLSRIRIVRATFPAGSSHLFTDRSDDAVMDGVITAKQRVRLLDTDLIARARRGRDSDQDVYVAVEVANQLDDEDVSRVVDSGVALAQMFPHAEILTAVYGRSISDAHRRLARAEGVDVFLTRDRS